MKRFASLYSVLFIMFISLALTGCSQGSSTGLTESEESTEVTLAETTVSIETQGETSSEVVTSTEVFTSTEVATTTTGSAFADYRTRSDDFVGWIKIEGTEIDAPLLQYTDNYFYLSHDIDKNPSDAGAIYIDYKNLGNFYDTHMAIYGHYMTNGTIFHDLHKFKSKDFYEAHPLIKISGLHETYTYEIFSVHIVSADDYYLYFDLTDEWLVEYAKHFKRLSMYDKALQNPAILENPEQLRLITLVTCTYEFDNARLLIHAYRLEKTDMPEH